MDIKKIITWAPILLAFIGSLYTGVNVVSKLNNTIEQHTITITSLGNQLDSMDTKYTIEVKNLTQKYTEGREELLKEMTQAYAMIAEVRVKAEALRDGSFKLASEAELRALEDSYYKLQDSIRQVEYDIKDIKAGGY